MESIKYFLMRHFGRQYIIVRRDDYNVGLLPMLASVRSYQVYRGCKLLRWQYEQLIAEIFPDDNVWWEDDYEEREITVPGAV